MCVSSTFASGCRRPGEFVVWDVGLGAAANATALLRATREVAGRLHIVSFDNTSEPLAFALENALELGHVKGYERQIAALLGDQFVQFKNGRTEVVWEFRMGDFPGWLERRLPSGQGTEQAAGRPARRTPSSSTPFPRPKTRPCGRCRYWQTCFARCPRAALRLDHLYPEHPGPRGFTVAGFYVGTGQARAGRRKRPSPQTAGTWSPGRWTRGGCCGRRVPTAPNPCVSPCTPAPRSARRPWPNCASTPNLPRNEIVFPAPPV